MLTCISSIVASWLISSGVVKCDDRELYEYATYSFLFSCIPFFLTIGMGLLLNMAFESFLVVSPIILIRKFGGGLHLSSPKTCFILSMVLLAASLLLVKHCSLNICLFSFLVLWGSLSIYIKSPIESESRKLSPKEHHFFKIVTHITLILFFIVYIFCFFTNIQRYCVSIGIGIIVTAVLQHTTSINFFKKRNS